MRCQVIVFSAHVATWSVEETVAQESLIFCSIPTEIGLWRISSENYTNRYKTTSVTLSAQDCPLKF